MSITFPISAETFEAFLQCETKSKLYSRGAIGVDLEFTDWERGHRDRYKESGLSWLRSNSQEHQLYVGTPPFEALKQKRWRIVADYFAESVDICARLDALELSPSADQTKCSFYRPVRFVPNEKLTFSDRLQLAFDALAISKITGKVPPNGKIIHGCKYSAAVIPLTKLVGKARTIVAKIVVQSAGTTPPPPVLNKHCTACEFRSQCQQIASEKDDLGLLTTVTAKERKTQNDRGIFTVTQLSYVFRPRRSSVRSSLKSRKHEPALKALAIRKKQIHVVGTPVWSKLGYPIYFDVEGVPDREFYYLIGLRYISGDRYVQRSFWADDPSEEKVM